MTYERRYVAAFPIGNDGYWIEKDRAIPVPTEMSFQYEQLRFIVPTEVVIRDLTPVLPTIGRAWDTNLVYRDRKILTHKEAKEQLLNVANVDAPPEANSMSERDDEYYRQRDLISDVHGAINAKLWESALWAVEMFSSCGDDGHVEYRFVGYALVMKEDVVPFINQQYGRWGKEVTFV